MSIQKLHDCVPTSNYHKLIGVLHVNSRASRVFGPNADKIRNWIMSKYGASILQEEEKEFTLADACAAIKSQVQILADSGFDGVCLINHGCGLKELAEYCHAARSMVDAKFSGSGFAVGVNYLGGSLAALDCYSLAYRLGLDMIWTDVSNSDDYVGHPRDEQLLEEIEEYRHPQVFYASGVHMKYQTLRNKSSDIRKDAVEAAKWLDGLTITGSGTGSPPNVETLKVVREAVGQEQAIGVASGVDESNIAAFGEYADYFLVATSLISGHSRCCDNYSAKRCRALARAIGC